MVKILGAHAMAALQLKYGNDYSLSIYKDFLPMYKTEAYLLTYFGSINVVSLQLKWCVTSKLLDVKILPPLIYTKLGKKKTKYYKGVDKTFKTKRRNNCALWKRPRH